MLWEPPNTATDIVGLAHREVGILCAFTGVDMDFADWVVQGIEAHLAGPSTGTEEFFQTVWDKFSGTAEMRDFMNTRSGEARGALVRLIDTTIQQDPGFGDRLRAAAPAQTPSQSTVPTGSGSSPGTGGGGNSRNILIAVAAAVIVIGGISLGLSMGGGGGGGSVSDADICGSAKQLHAATDDMGTAAYQAHLSDWHALLDKAKKASDSKVSSYAKDVDPTARNEDNYYSELSAIMDDSCGQ